MTEIHVLLDKSGSMRTIKDDSIGGYNEFLDLQKASDNADNIYWSLSTFNNNYENEFSKMLVRDVNYLLNADFFVSGGTALYDALGMLIQSIDEECFHNYIIVIITDGCENSSKKYDSHFIKKLIDTKTSDCRNETESTWDFIYLGANQDAILESSKIGIKRNSTMNYNTNRQSIKELYNGVSKAISRKISDHSDLSFTDVERNASQQLDTPKLCRTKTIWCGTNNTHQKE